MKIQKFTLTPLIQLYFSCNYRRCSLSNTLLLTLVGNLPYYMTWLKFFTFFFFYLLIFELTIATNELKKSESTKVVLRLPAQTPATSLQPPTHSLQLSARTHFQITWISKFLFAVRSGTIYAHSHTHISSFITTTNAT